MHNLSWRHPFHYDFLRHVYHGNGSHPSKHLVPCREDILTVSHMKHLGHCHEDIQTVSHMKHLGHCLYLTWNTSSFNTSKQYEWTASEQL